MLERTAERRLVASIGDAAAVSECCSDCRIDRMLLKSVLLPGPTLAPGLTLLTHIPQEERE